MIEFQSPLDTEQNRRAFAFACGTAYLQACTDLGIDVGEHDRWGFWLSDAFDAVLVFLVAPSGETASAWSRITPEPYVVH